MQKPEHTIFIDWESYYSKLFSLTKMTTQEYCLHPEFQAIGIGVRMNGERYWFTGTFNEFYHWLRNFPWEDALVVAHNAIFDASILEWIFDIHPAKWFCTMMGARPTAVPWTKNGRMSLAVMADYLGLPAKGTAVVNALGKRREDFTPAEMEEYKDYCLHDTWLCEQLYEWELPQLPQMELDLIDATVKKYVRPMFMLNQHVLTERLAIVKAAKEEALATALLVDRAILMSNPQFAEALIKLGVTPPTKESPATGKETYAFAKSDPEFKELLDHPDERVQALVAARLKVKSTQEETRLARFIAITHTLIGKQRFGVPLLYYGAHTGRFSGLDKLNLQNLPRGGALRAALVAPEGHKVVAGDLSQIEARITAMLAGQRDLVEQFRQGEDVYSIFASKAYGYKVTKDTHAFPERFVGKTCILGLGFGVGWVKLQSSLKAAGVECSDADAEKYVHTYRNGFSNVPRLWRAADKLISYMKAGKTIRLGPIHTIKEAIVLPNGMRLNYPDLQQKDGQWTYLYRGKRTYLYGAKLIENIVQALARIIVSTAEVWLYRRGWLSSLQVHDELVYVVPEPLVEKFMVVLERTLTRPVEWMEGLPVACEVAMGDNYAEAK